MAHRTRSLAPRWKMLVWQHGSQCVILMCMYVWIKYIAYDKVFIVNESLNLWNTWRTGGGLSCPGLCSSCYDITNKHVENKTENPSKDALQKAENLKKKCKLCKISRLTWVTRQTTLTKLTRQTRQTRQIFPPNRLQEGWCENRQTCEIANLQFRCVSQWVSYNHQCKRC